MNSENIIFIGGIYNLSFAVFHVFFWRIFNWKVSLRKLNSVDKSTIQVLNISLIVAFLIFAYLSIFYSNELVSTNLGVSITLLISLFWFARAIQQIYFYGLKNKFSSLLFIVFILGGLLYLYPTLIY